MSGLAMLNSEAISSITTELEAEKYIPEDRRGWLYGAKDGTEFRNRQTRDAGKDVVGLAYYSGAWDLAHSAL
jgi:hypothetical protein